MYVANPGALVRVDAQAAATRSDSKLVQLEALRGLAALIVVAWHFLWAFDPARLGIVGGFDPASAMLGSVSFASIDGPAAVTLFFVLSGFVLPLGFFRSGRTEIVVRAAAKRWLRLVCLVLLAALLSYLLFRLGLYRHREAAQISQSTWLDTFGGSHDKAGFAPSFLGALLEGSLLAFLRDPDMYDPVLWTMHHEFLGSFVTFFLAVVLWRAPVAAAVWALVTAAIITQFTDPFLFAFVIGTGLAWIMSRYDVRLPSGLALACIALGIFLFGYLEPRGAYAGLAAVKDPGPDAVRPDRHPYGKRSADHSRAGRQRPARAVAGVTAIPSARPPVIPGLPVPFPPAVLAGLRLVHRIPSRSVAPTNIADGRRDLCSRGDRLRLRVRPR